MFASQLGWLITGKISLNDDEDVNLNFVIAQLQVNYDISRNLEKNLDEKWFLKKWNANELFLQRLKGITIDFS